MSGFAWVTLATNDSYSLGALVLAHSLRQVGTIHQLAVLVTPGVTGVMREKLASVFNLVKEVNILDSRDEANLRLLQRPDLGITFTKLHCWRLTQFSKCVFLDADTLVLQNADELFEREEFSAAPDVGWPDCFNSGVFVYRPSEDTYGKLIQFALEKGSFDGGDQGLLNLYFSDWAHKDISKHLPFIYNMCSTACYSYLPAFKQFGGNVKIIHFIGNAKPWLQYFDTESRQVQVTPGLQHLSGIVQQWWNIFCSLVHPALSSQMTRSRAPAVHYASYHSDTRSVPSEYTPYTESNALDDVAHTDNTNYENVWDPWDDYEKNRNEGLILQSFSSHTQEFSHKHEDNLNKIAEHYEKPIESCQPSKTAAHDSNSGIQFLPKSQFLTFDSSTNNDSTNIDNCKKPSSISSDRFKNDISEHLAPSQPAQESSNLNTSPNSYSTLAYTPSDCNQLAWPHECEPASCVTKESALHDSHSEVNNGNAGLAGAFAQLTLGVPRTAEQSILEDHLRRQGWEVGNIDYMGRDSFDNIWSKICETLATPSTPAEPAKPAEVAAVQPAASPVAFVQPQQQPSEPVKASEEPPAVAAETPVLAAAPKIEPVLQLAASQPPPVAESEPPKSSAAVTKVEPPAPVAEPVECPKPASALPSEAPKPALGSPGEPPKEAAVAVPPPAQEPKVPPPIQESKSPALAQEPKTPATEEPKHPTEKPEPAVPIIPQPEKLVIAPPKPQQAPEKAGGAVPASPKPQQTPPSSPSPKTQSKATPDLAKAAEASKASQIPPTSPAPKTQPKAEQVAAPKPQPTPEPAKQPEGAPPSSPLPKAQPKAMLPKETVAAASETPPSPSPAQPKEKSAKKQASTESASAEKPPSEEVAGGQGPTPPPRKTGGGGGGTKKAGKGKK